MSEINWDLAPEGAVELRLGRVDAISRWFNSDGEAFGSDGWFTPTIEYKTIATRPQQKTVADAYEWANGEWRDGREVIWYSSDSEDFRWGSDKTKNIVCTRQQFEAYAKEQEAKQEGEKWTHTLDGVKCRVLVNEPDVDGEVVILLENGRYSCSDPIEDLKPIKLALTKAEAWGMVMDTRDRKKMGLSVIDDKVSWILDKYEII